MNEIVILSGKGGTGKTSLAASLAVLAGNNAVIADCDVDAANMHLLLKPDFAKKDDFYGSELAIIDPVLCTLCGLCEMKCRFNAISLRSETYKVDPIDCEGCGYCEKVCPVNAIVMVPRKSGEVYISSIRTGASMVHASMETGAENSGKLVTKVREEARKIALSQGVPLIIADGSPGLGCPVIASLAGASRVLLVTEPSVAALHDLRRLMEIIRNFRIKAQCVINKSDLNPDRTKEIRAFLDSEGVEYLGDIPYDEKIAGAMSSAKTFAESDTDGTKAIKKLWKLLKTELL